MFQFTFFSLWAFLTVAPFLFSQPVIHGLRFEIVSLGGLLSLSLGSSVFAFYLQLKAQNILSNTATTMISLLESPIAAAFSFLILGEFLNGTQVLGIAIIMIASSLTVRFDKPNPASVTTT